MITEILNVRFEEAEGFAQTSEMRRLPPVCFIFLERTGGSGGESGMSVVEGLNKKSDVL